MFLTSLKQICNEYLIKFSENLSAPKLENRKTSPCAPCAPNLLHVLVSLIIGYHNLCSPVHHYLHLQEPLLHHPFGIDWVDRRGERHHLVLIITFYQGKGEGIFKKRKWEGQFFYEGSPVPTPCPQCPGFQTCQVGSRDGRCPGE